MNKKLKTVLLLVVFVLFIGVAAWGYNLLTDRLPAAGITPETAPVAQEDEETAEGAPETAPVTQQEKKAAADFTVTDIDGNTVTLSQFKGQPIVLNFWASWCPPCIREMPTFNQAYQDLGEDAVFMMVNMTDGQRETKETAMAFVEEGGFSFPVYFDTEEQDAARAYSISSIPRTIFIDKEGNISYDRLGVVDEDTLRQQIELIQ